MLLSAIPPLHNDSFLSLPAYYFAHKGGPVDKVIVPEQILANTTHQRQRKQKKGGLNHPLEVQGHDGKETFLSHGWNASFSDFG